MVQMNGPVGLRWGLGAGEGGEGMFVKRGPKWAEVSQLSFFKGFVFVGILKLTGPSLRGLRCIYVAPFAHGDGSRAMLGVREKPCSDIAANVNVVKTRKSLIPLNPPALAI